MLIEAPPRSYLTPTSARLLDTLPQLTDKMVVDLVNGLATTRDHVGEAARMGRIARFMDGITGHGARRRTVIDTSMVEHVQTCVNFLRDLDLAQARSMFAISQVASKVSALVEVSGLLAFDIEVIESDIASLREQAESLKAELQRVDAVQKATLHLTDETDRWEAGLGEAGSPLARAFLMLDALYWGPFGDCVRHASQAREEAKWLGRAGNAVKRQLRLELDCSADQPLPLVAWRKTSTISAPLVDDAVRYLAEPVNAFQPLSLVLSREDATEVPHRAPRTVSINRMVDRLGQEIFIRRRFA